MILGKLKILNEDEFNLIYKKINNTSMSYRWYLVHYNSYKDKLLKLDLVQNESGKFNYKFNDKHNSMSFFKEEIIITDIKSKLKLIKEIIK